MPEDRNAGCLLFTEFINDFLNSVSLIGWRHWTSDYDYILITNLMHWLLFIHKILFSCTCFEPQVLIFRRIQLYTCSIWYCHSLWEFVVACRYTAWVRTDCGGRLVGRHTGLWRKVCMDMCKVSADKLIVLYTMHLTLNIPRGFL